MDFGIDHLYRRGQIIYKNKKFNFEDFDIACNEILEAFHKRSICLVIDDKSIESTIAIISLLLSKNHIIFIDSLIASKQISELIKKFKCDFIIGSDKTFNKLKINKNIQHSYFAIQKCRNSSKKIIKDNIPLLLLGTSGSSGVSKFVGITHPNLFENCKSICKYLKNDQKTVSINNLPCSYSYGLSVLNTTLYKGGKYIISEENSFLRRGFWDDVQKYEITDFSGVPTTYKSLLKFDCMNFFPKSLKRLTQAGGRLENQIQQELLEYSLKMNFEFFIMYGQTEATARLTFLNLTREPHKIGSVGRVIPGVKVVENEGLEDKESRNLTFKGKNISLGYFSNFDDINQSKDSFEGVLKTGDIGYVDNDGCITITGRESRFAKIDGHRIALDDLERKLSKESDNLAIVSNDQFLFVVLPNSVIPFQKRISKFISQNSTIHISKIKVLDLEIPLTNNGKISYSKLLNDIEETIK